MCEVLFSYSHRDEGLRNELEIHLSSLKRQGVITTWHDRRVGAGEEVHDEVSRRVETADIILLLVSPYFLASDYCYEVEMQRAMERHEAGEARVIPVILHPCDWQRAPFGKLLAVPTDGKPVSKFPNQHDAFLEITQAIRQVAEDMGRPVVQAQSGSERPAEPPPVPIVSDIRSSNLRMKRTFSDRDRDRFLDEVFTYIANFFEGSLEELKRRNQQVDTAFKRIDANHFTAVVYRNGSMASSCKIWLGGRHSFGGGICYSTLITSNDNSLNESLSVKDDGYILFLQPLGMLSRTYGEEQQFTPEGAAEYFWAVFIGTLQG